MVINDNIIKISNIMENDRKIDKEPLKFDYQNP